MEKLIEEGPKSKNLRAQERKGPRRPCGGQLGSHWRVKNRDPAVRKLLQRPKDEKRREKLEDAQGGILQLITALSLTANRILTAHDW